MVDGQIRDADTEIGQRVVERRAPSPRGDGHRRIENRDGGMAHADIRVIHHAPAFDYAQLDPRVDLAHQPREPLQQDIPAASGAAGGGIEVYRPFGSGRHGKRASSP